jgi:CSLREA domain-containing protein
VVIAGDSVRRAGLGAVVGLASFGLCVTSAAANRYDVNTTADHAPGKCSKSDCTLREAVIRANAHSGPDRVILPKSDQPFELSRRAGTSDDMGYVERRGDLDLGDQLTVRGKGPKKTVVRQTTRDRAFQVEPGASFGSEISGITITDADGQGVVGGGVLTQGVLFIGRTKIVHNNAAFGGGVAGLGALARLTVSESTVADNRAEATGGGIYLSGTDEVTNGVVRSLVESNRAPQGGGGIYFRPGDANLNVISSTITLNQSLGLPQSNGGGLYTETTASGPGIAKVEQATIASNEAPGGAGAQIHPEIAVQMENSIVGLDLGGGDTCDLPVDSSGHNLDYGTDCGLDQGTDLEGADARLEPLARNGGPTRTRALKASSDAIGEGACPGTILQLGVDQRGEGRPNVCDIGAFERDPL